MSNAEYVSKSVPMFSRLADILRNSSLVQFVLARFAALRHNERPVEQTAVSEFAEEDPALDDAGGAVAGAAVVLPSPGDPEITAPPGSDDAIEDHAKDHARDDTKGSTPEDDRREREQLIRRRWQETGIKMWNPDVMGAGPTVLGIQGRVALLPPKPGGERPRVVRLG